MAQEPDAEIELDMGADASRTVGEFQRSCPPLTVRSITPVARWRPRRKPSLNQFGRRRMYAVSPIHP
jgi:hypothetical protein